MRILPHGLPQTGVLYEVMDQGRLELYDMLKPKLDEETARRLVLALPSQPDQLATMTWRMILVVGAWATIATSLFAFMSNLV
jgi:hypothetical protein